jgi:hypothetical protein
MRTISRRFDDGVRKRRDVDETMGTAQPPGRIRRCRCQVDARMCVGVEGSQGGGAGREKWRNKNEQTHCAVGVTGFFLIARCTTVDM